MNREITRGEFLAEGSKVCLCLVAGGVLVQGCKEVVPVDVEKTRPPGAPATFIGKEEDVNPAFYFVKGKLKGILVRTEKGIVGYENKCTHEGGPTVFEEKVLACVWHGSVFDPATGKVLKGPAQKPLPPLKIEVKDGLVLLVKG